MLMLYKNTLKKVKKSFGRYLSMLIIVFVGVGFFTGLQSTVPDIIDTTDKYFQDYNLMDFKIVSSMGLTDEDVSALKKLEGVKQAVPGYSLDLLAQNKALRISSIDDIVNKVKLIDGRMPEAENEALADDQHYKIGDIIDITSDVDGQLGNTQFTVVGTIESVLYFSKDYGSTTIGDGKLSSFAFIPKSNFTLDSYTEIYLTMKGMDSVSTDSDTYNDAVEQLNKELLDIKSHREEARYEQILSMYSMGNSETGDSLTNIEMPVWYIYDRDVITGYSYFYSSVELIGNIAGIFPFFFIAIVLLMTSNSMARMIAEERGELGTLSSLGFNDRKITGTYLLYVLSASGIGIVTGFFIGSRFIPPVIFDTFKYILPSLEIHYDILSFAVIFLVTFLLMSIVTITACRKELKEKPAALMRPSAPKKGQKIFLERLGFIWNHLSFTWKVTMRNMFRYKKRALMTIVGVAGCASFLVVGFGLRDSMNGVVPKQYGDIFRYSNISILKEETAGFTKELSAVFSEAELINPLLLRQSAVEVISGERTMDTYIMVPENEKDFERYFKLSSYPDKEKIGLDDSGVIITQRIAEIYSVEKGDYITIQGSQKNTFELKISNIAENYVSNYIYMDKDVYLKVFGDEVLFNTVAAGQEAEDDVTAQKLIGSGYIFNVMSTSDIMQGALDGNESLNSIVTLIIIVASLLALLVLYNLTSINISERIREIATLKVLGFRDGETNAYIYREALLLTLISTVVGMVLGIFLHRLIMGMIEGDSMAFFKEIKWTTFLISFILTMFFSGVMQMVTYFKLKKINMIESLKSVE